MFLGGEVRALQLLGFELFVVTEQSGTIEAMLVDGWDWTVTPLWSTTEPLDVVDAARDLTGDIYISGSTSMESGFARVDSTGQLDWIWSGVPGRLHQAQVAGFSALIGVVSESGEEARVLGISEGQITSDTTVFGFVNPTLGDIGTDVDRIRIPFVDVGIVMGLYIWSGSPEVWLDPGDGIVAPLDVSSASEF